MAARDIRKNFSLWVDGRNYAGQVEEFNAPKLTLQTEDFRAGGMDLPVKVTMGMEAMDCDFSLKAYDRDVLALFGVVEGASVPLVVREALESFDGTVTQVVRTMRGKITELDEGTSKPGEIPMLKVSMNLTYYKMQHGDRVVHEIDAENMVRTINGVDALSAIRSALGM
ncbi:phage major tail tube protein [Microvirga sp. 17 mud 1-3]|uniref:phage major tail tube protein n=1 Tax=Microvirga sp. 17 mud 1-3 TaxID=2082949 RepID=UPI000D6BB1E7|nr:phage major tail tube protein [Microvirga sp. 17 mud 1-3]AWM87377.1 phage major tail tube protein [Microvirga sp. 17 mud 1-3]